MGVEGVAGIVDKGEGGVDVEAGYADGVWG